MKIEDELLALNPFPGLRPFATNEADRFFGRRQQIAEVAARLDEVDFIAITGASGCGKSSLIRAGVLSELARRSASGEGLEWRCMVMRPGKQPIANLADQLAPLLGKRDESNDSNAGLLYGQLKLGGRGLVEAVQLARLGPKSRVLIVVDQFEELFRFKGMTVDEEARAFVKLLLNAAFESASPVSVIVTLRSDTLGYCADFRGLPEAISHGQYLVPKLTREQRKEAIVAPVAWRGFEIEGSLVQRVLNDISDDFDDLPIMQHALTRTWLRWAEASHGDRALNVDDYEKIGTAQNALSNHATEICQSLPGLEPIVKKVFCALTEHLAGGTEQRRPLEFDVLSEVVGGNRTDVETVVERFRESDSVLVMAVPDGPLSANPVIDISHESLIRQWPQLREWAQQEYEDSKTLNRLVEAAERRSQHQGDLWRGLELQHAFEWQQTIKPTEAWIGLYIRGNSKTILNMVETFVRQSVDEVRRERLRRIWQVVIVGTCAMIITVGFIVPKLMRQSSSRELAATAFQRIGQDPASSAHLALAAVEQDSKNELGRQALRRSLSLLEAAYPVKLLLLGAAVKDVRFTQDRSRLVVASGNTVRILNSGTYEPVRNSIQTDMKVWRAWLMADKTTLVTQAEDRQVTMQNVNGSGLQQLSCPGGKENSIYAAAVSSDDRHIAVGCYDGAVLVFDAFAHRIESWSHKIKDDVTVTALAFSSDNQYLASGDVNGTVNLWKLGEKAAWIGQHAKGNTQSPINHKKDKGYAGISDIGFSERDPNLLLTSSEDGQAIVWLLDWHGRRLKQVEKGEKNHWPLSHGRPVSAGKFISLHDNEASVLTISGKNAQTWTDSRSKREFIRTHDDWVTDANVSADGEQLVTASNDGLAHVWSTRSVRPIATLRGHTGSVNRALFSADETHVVTGSEDGTVRVWHVQGPRLLQSRPNAWALGVALDPHGTRVAVGGEEFGQILGIDDLTNTTQALDLPRVTGSLSNLSWSKQGQYLVGRQSPRNLYSATTVSLWDTQDGSDITPEWLGNMQWAVFSSGTDDLVTVNREGKLAVWDTKHLHDDRTVPQPIREINADPLRRMAALSPDGKWIAASRGDRGQIWRRDDPHAAPRELVGHKGDIQSLQFSPDSKWLLTASADRTALIWSVEREDPPKELKGGHSASLFSASFRPDGKLVVTGGADRRIGVWNADDAQLLASLEWHTEGVNAVAFSNQGDWVLSASDDGSVMFGQCEACTLSVEALKTLVPERARLPQHELDQVRKEIEAAIIHPTGLGFFKTLTGG